jgi:hypothetical protein
MSQNTRTEIPIMQTARIAKSMGKETALTPELSVIKQTSRRVILLLPIHGSDFGMSCTVCCFADFEGERYIVSQGRSHRIPIAQWKVAHVPQY